jgi:dienelactone hydrolase
MRLLRILAPARVVAAVGLAACASTPPAEHRSHASRTSASAPRAPTSAAASAPSATSAAASAEAPAIEPVGPKTEPLDVPGFLPSLLVVPAGPGPHPLLVVTHGAGGRPEPHCARYAELSKGRAFVLCTPGHENNRMLPPEQRGYFYDGHHELGREVLAARAALIAKYGERVDASGAMFAGYSQGASMGLLFLHEKGEHAALFSTVLLVEGGYEDWNIALSERMKRAGMKRVAIVCGQSKCNDKARLSLHYMKQGGLDARLLYASRAGHTYEGTVRPLVDEAFSWVTEGDERFGEHELDASLRNLGTSKP